MISFRGGSLRYVGSTDVTLSTGGVNRPLQMTAAGGGSINVEDQFTTLTVPGPACFAALARPSRITT